MNLKCDFRILALGLVAGATAAAAGYALGYVHGATAGLEAALKAMQTSPRPSPEDTTPPIFVMLAPTLGALSLFFAAVAASVRQTAAEKRT